jgi:DNA ligase-4
VSGDGSNLFYIVFDLIFFVDIDNNAFDLRRTELKDRKDLLSRIILPVEHRVETIHSKYIAEPSVDDVKEFLKQALDRKQEGIIVKRANSHYQLNVRGQGWYKVKADYDSTFTDTLDLVVLGCYFSESISDSVISTNPIDAITSFLVGVPKTSPEGTTEFRTVTKVSTGLTRTQLVFLRNQLRNAVVPVPAGQLPNWLGEWKPAKADRPDVFVDPFNKESCVVLEVNAGEILQSGEFSSGFQLRFPRIVRPRADKDWADATSFDDLRNMATADRDHDRVFIQNLSKFERGYEAARSPKEPKKRKKEVIIIQPNAQSSKDTQQTLKQESQDDW